MKKIVTVLGIFALTLTLFSFKSADSNESNLGKATIHYKSTEFVKHDYTSSPSRARVLKEVAKKVVEGAKKVGGKAKEVWDQNGKKAAKVVVKAAFWLLLSPNPELDYRDYSSQMSYKLSQL